jgi:ABC-type polysaccharide/polyol phosphate transport system ATPase subunit
MTENLEKYVVPGIVWDPTLAIKGIRKLNELKDREGAMIIVGHDGDAWKQVKHAPEYYD